MELKHTFSIFGGYIYDIWLASPYERRFGTTMLWLFNFACQVGSGSVVEKKDWIWWGWVLMINWENETFYATQLAVIKFLPFIIEWPSSSFRHTNSKSIHVTLKNNFAIQLSLGCIVSEIWHGKSIIIGEWVKLPKRWIMCCRWLSEHAK